MGNTWNEHVERENLKALRRRKAYNFQRFIENSGRPPTPKWPGQSQLPWTATNPENFESTLNPFNPGIGKTNPFDRGKYLDKWRKVTGNPNWTGFNPSPGRKLALSEGMHSTALGFQALVKRSPEALANFKARNPALKANRAESSRLQDKAMDQRLADIAVRASAAPLAERVKKTGPKGGRTGRAGLFDRGNFFRR